MFVWLPGEGFDSVVYWACLIASAYLRLVGKFRFEMIPPICSLIIFALLFIIIIANHSEEFLVKFLEDSGLWVVDWKERRILYAYTFF